MPVHSVGWWRIYHAAVVETVGAVGIEEAAGGDIGQRAAIRAKRIDRHARQIRWDQRLQVRWDLASMIQFVETDRKTKSGGVTVDQRTCMKFH